jgi:hypothetical protein
MTIAKVTLAQFKRQVQSRITKGEAFSMGADEWDERQKRVKEELDQMSLAEVKAKYPSHSYGFKVQP